MASADPIPILLKGRAWWFPAGMLLIYLGVWLLDPSLGAAALNDFLISLRRLLPLLLVMFALLWLFNLLLKPRRIVKRLRKQSGLRGWLLAVSGGVLSVGPMYLWYPLLGELKQHGLRPGLAAAFLYSRAVKIPLLPFMAHYFGSLYTGLFVVCIIVFSVVNGLIIQRLNH